MTKKTNENPDVVPIGSVVVTLPDNQRTEENTEALAEIEARLEAVDTRITEGLEGERQWTTQTITSLQNELRELKTLLQSTTENLTASTAALRDELILQLREAREKLEKQEKNPEPLPPPQETPPNLPPDNSPPPLESDAEGPLAQQKPGKKTGKRVI